MELAFLISSSSLLLSAAEMLLLELELVPVEPVHKVLNELSVGSVVSVPDEAGDRVVRGLM